MNMFEKVPVTVLTGYLGAGKTTLLNHILSENHGRAYAVIVNEFGEIGIDNDLVVDSDEEIFEMNNGCVCCTVRGDLIRILNALMKRKGRFDGILIETTGVADPAPVAQTFFMDEDVREKTRLDAVITLADAKNLHARLNDAREARKQIAFADVILVNKIDLLSEDEISAIEAEIRQINPYAKLHRTERGILSLEKILDRGAFDLNRILTLDPEFLQEEEPHPHDHHDHHHHYGHNHHDHGDITSLSLRAERDLDPDVFFPWINQVIMAMGPDILRCKGILAIANDDQKYVLQGVHMMMEGDRQRLWGKDEERESRLVFIGRNLDKATLKHGFEACLVKG